MKTKNVIKIATSIVLVSIFSVASAQTEDNRSKRVDKDCVINMKMIEKFNKSYSEVEVVAWQDVLLNHDFEKARTYLNAYLNTNLDQVSPKDLNQSIERKVAENLVDIKLGLDKKRPLALNDTDGNLASE